MKNPIKQLKKVQAALAEQAYASYCYGYRDGNYNLARLSKQAFFKKIKDVILEGERLQKPKWETPNTQKQAEKYTEV